MNRRWMGVVAAALAIGCAKRFVVVSPDDPGFCERCHCPHAPPICPGALEHDPRCTLAEVLRAFPDDSFSTHLVQCGPLVVFRRGTSSHGRDQECSRGAVRQTGVEADGWWSVNIREGAYGPPSPGRSWLGWSSDTLPHGLRLALNLPERRADVGTYAYQWQRSTDGTRWIDLPGTNEASAVVAGLSPGTLYFFRYRTLLPNVLSDWSDPVTFRVT